MAVGPALGAETRRAHVNEESDHKALLPISHQTVDVHDINEKHDH